MNQQRMSGQMPQVYPNSSQQYGAQISRQPSVSSVNTVSTTNTFGRRPPSYATHESVDDRMDYRWPGNEGAWSLRPPSYQTAPSVYEENEEEDSSADLRPLVPLRYAPSANFLENQFSNASSVTMTSSQDDERPETPTLSNLQMADRSQQELYELTWNGYEGESVQTPTAAKPPEYGHPTSFSIYGAKTEALLSTYHISGHLSLMYEFWRLRNRVEGLDNPADQPVTPFPREKDRRWAWLVSFAVDRFSIWCQSLKSADVQCSIQEIMPPVDVLMIWHSYLLNPSRYLEDCKRIPCLLVLSQIGQMRLVPALGGELFIILDSPPMEIRKQIWHTKTQGRAFDIFEDARQSRYKVLKCPDCESKIEHPYMDSHGTGYLQHKFECYCSNLSCSFIEKPFNKNAMGARKLADDIVRSDDTLQTYLAGTLWSLHYGINKVQASRMKNLVKSEKKLECPKVFTDEEMILSVLKRYVKSEVLQLNDLIKPVNFANNGWAWELLKQHKYSLHQLVDSIHASLRNESFRASQDIFMAYADGDIFSLDLVGAVLRQSSFVQKMCDIGWSRPGFFAPSENEIVLQHTVARYHAFLDLVAASGKYKTFVPTLDIDLAWHTHQLFGPVYQDHCKKYVHVYLDHYDKVEETRLALAFDETSRAWRSRFKVPYSFCGCPQPGKQMFGGDVSFTDTYEAQKDLLKPRSADDIVFQTATHPSDHNAIYDNRRKIDAQINRKNRLDKRSKRETREEGLLKGLTKGRSAKLESTEPHDPAFFAEIPDWYLKSTERANCVLYSAHTLDSEHLDLRKVSSHLLRYSDLIPYAVN